MSDLAPSIRRRFVVLRYWVSAPEKPATTVRNEMSINAASATARPPIVAATVMKTGVRIEMLSTADFQFQSGPLKLTRLPGDRLHQATSAMPASADLAVAGRATRSNSNDRLNRASSMK